ncbi:AAA family ATPase [Chloroflexi bacterium TSY]|nr:AAA family ATPase [Chloroflexi bacterium TSY]
MESEEQTVDDLHRATELYQAEFLEGLSLTNAPEFEQWQLMQRRQLRHKMLNALEELVEHEWQRGDAEAAIRYLHRVIALESWRESAYRQLMRLLARQGEYESALTQYHACCSALAEDLMIEPTEETQRLAKLIHDLRNQTQRHNLPTSSKPFVGRQDELAKISQQLNDPNCRLLTLVGPGGIGKTRLAIEAAANQIERFLHGVLFVSLIGLTSTKHLATAIAEAMEYPIQGNQHPDKQLLDWLRNKELLLVLDNYEHLLPNTNLLKQILLDAPSVKLFVTSRERLNLQIESLHHLVGLNFPSFEIPRERKPDKGAYSAVDLFVQTASRVQPHIVLDEARADVNRICQLVEGMPLGIELAAGWMHLLTSQQIIEQLEKDIEVLHTTASDVPLRHRSLRNVFDSSWEMLSVEEQTILAKLAIFRGRFTFATAETIAGATLSVLSVLLDKSLLRRADDGRFELHELVRQYSMGQLSAYPNEYMSTLNQYIDFYAHFLSERKHQLRGPDQKVVRKEIRMEFGNIRQVWNWSIKHRRLSALQKMTRSLMDFYDIQGWFNEGQAAFGRAIQAFTTEDSLCSRSSPDDTMDQTRDAQHQELLGQLYACHGWLCFTAGRHIQARGFLQKSLQLLPPGNTYTKNDSESIYPLVTLSSIAFAQGEYQQARRYINNALRWQRKVGERWEEAYTLGQLALVLLALGEPEQAYHSQQDGLAIAAEIGDQRLIALGTNFLSPILCLLGDYKSAKQMAQQGLEMSRSIHHVWGGALAQFHLGVVSALTGEHLTAYEHFQNGLAEFRRTGDPWGTANTLSQLAPIATLLQQHDDAIDYTLEALRLAVESNLAPVMLDVLASAAAILAQNQQTSQAHALLTLVHTRPESTAVAKLKATMIAAMLPTDESAQNLYESLPLSAIIANVQAMLAQMRKETA